MDKESARSIICKGLMVLGIIYILLCYAGYIEKTQAGVFRIVLVCFINYVRASFDSDTKWMIGSLILMFALLMAALFEFLMG